MTSSIDGSTGPCPQTAAGVPRCTIRSTWYAAFVGSSAKPSSDSPALLRMVIRACAAYGRRVSTQRVDGELTNRFTPYAARIGASAVARSLAARVQRPQRVRALPRSARAGLGVPDDRERPGRQLVAVVGLDERAELLLVARVVQPQRGLVGRQPGHLVDLVAPARRCRRPPRPPSSGPPWWPARSASRSGRSRSAAGGRGARGSPVSSATSRTAATGQSSPGVELALGPGPVVVPRPVHHRDLQDALAPPPRQRSRGRRRRRATGTRTSGTASGSSTTPGLAVLPVGPVDQRTAARRATARRRRRGGAGSRSRRPRGARTTSRRWPPCSTSVRSHSAWPVVADPDQRLDPAVQVAVHHVGAADQADRLAATLEVEDPRVLEEPAEHRPHPDRLGQPWDARAGWRRCRGRRGRPARRPARRGRARR